jgi:hypothetical protein
MKMAKAFYTICLVLIVGFSVSAGSSLDDSLLQSMEDKIKVYIRSSFGVGK